jgi:RNA polymerase sigma factor (sigma-70 family)
MDRDAIFIEFAPLVEGLLRRYGTDPELRSDLPGEIYYRLCHFLDRYDPTRGVPLKAYLIRQISTSIYSYARKQWRIKRREVSWDEIGGGNYRFLSDDCISEVKQSWVLHDFGITLQEALAQLSARQREVVALRFSDCLSYGHIAEKLDVSVSTAQSLMRDAMRHLRQRFMSQASTSSS